MKTVLLLAALLVSSTVHAAAPVQLPASDVTDADVQRFFTAVNGARGYNDLVTILTQYEPVLVSARLTDWIDAQVNNPALDENQRGFLMLARLTAQEGRDRGAREAAQLLSVRLIAGAMLAADTPQQIAGALTTFAEFAPIITPALVRAALDIPGNSWPRPLLALMEQLAVDWPRLGAVAASTRMAEAASALGDAPQANGVTRGANDPVVVGHWQTTRIVFESPRDDHLVLMADGTAERWSTTAAGTGAKTTGRWTATTSVLTLTWTGDDPTSQPFTMYENQLVLPNISGRRVFWERVGR